MTHLPVMRLSAATDPRSSVLRVALSNVRMVAMYFDTLDAKHRLIGFPVSTTQYWGWRTEVSEYQRSQYKK